METTGPHWTDGWRTIPVYEIAGDVCEGTELAPRTVSEVLIIQ